MLYLPFEFAKLHVDLLDFQKWNNVPWRQIRSGLSSEFPDQQSSVSCNQLFDHRKRCESDQVCSAYSEMKDDEGQPLIRLVPPGLPENSSAEQ
ncbi:hypothetical protein V6N13_009704 [Hibiscus sabdariffa]|uniref:Uncharacterized protein n=1 Tax=Hibiscus sabdariffa TaxID=183260 RepID=A0ABR2B4F0_9ROSI